MVQSIVILLVCLLLAAVISERLRLPHPLVLIVVGILAAFLLRFDVPSIEPEIVLSVILPFLLYWEALNISLQGIKQALRGIILNGTLMVIVVAVAVGAIGPAIGLPLAVSLLIGAAVAPTDATAVEAMGKGTPRRAKLILRAESMINDGTALVIFALGVEFAQSDRAIDPWVAVGKFIISFGGAVLVGLIIGMVITRCGRYVSGAMAGNLFRLLVPFASYILAEEIGASGVLATVVAGLYLGQTTPRFVTVESRVFGRPAWIVSTYILNSLLFLLVGLHLPSVVRDLHGDTIHHALLSVVVIFVVMILVRGVFFEVSIRIIRLLDRRPSQHERRTTFADRLVMTTAGFRGAISIAVAFSIPNSVANRDVVIFVTAGVVILSLVIQGALMQPVLRLQARTANPWRQKVDLDRDAEVAAAYQETARRLLPQLDTLALETQADAHVVADYRAHLETLASQSKSEVQADLQEQEKDQGRKFQLALLRAKRDSMVQLRDERLLDDETLIYIFEMLDIEELRLIGPASPE
ncbi:MAG: Na+/H+ antiporter [Corynebacterium sp.]|nr:Na+/H+ antiporter [Corynebacterium sp.]